MDNTTNEILNAAAEMFVFMYYCPRHDSAWKQFYKNLLKTNKPDTILLTLNRLMKTEKQKVARSLLEYLENHWNLKFRNITTLGKKFYPLAQVFR